MIFAIFLLILFCESCALYRPLVPGDDDTSGYVKNIEVTVAGPEAGVLMSNYNYIHPSMALGSKSLDGLEMIGLAFEMSASNDYQIQVAYPRDSLIIDTNILVTNKVEFSPLSFVYYLTNDLVIKVTRSDGEIIINEVW